MPGLMGVPTSREPALLRWYLPELGLCRSALERQQAAAQMRIGREGWTRALWIPIVAFVLYLAVVPLVYLWARPYWLPMWSMSLVMTPAAIVFPFIILFMVREQARRNLRKHLLSRGIPVCLHCGYDRRGLVPESLACPECGTARSP